jgi:hypothetical protein
VNALELLVGWEGPEARVPPRYAKLLRELVRRAGYVRGRDEELDALMTALDASAHAYHRRRGCDAFPEMPEVVAEVVDDPPMMGRMTTAQVSEFLGKSSRQVTNYATAGALSSEWNGRGYTFDTAEVVLFRAALQGKRNDGSLDV